MHTWGFDCSCKATHYTTCMRSRHLVFSNLILAYWSLLTHSLEHDIFTCGFHEWHILVYCTAYTANWILSTKEPTFAKYWLLKWKSIGWFEENYFKLSYILIDASIFSYFHRINTHCLEQFATIFLLSSRAVPQTEVFSASSERKNVWYSIHHLLTNTLRQKCKQAQSESCVYSTCTSVCGLFALKRLKNYFHGCKCV